MNQLPEPTDPLDPKIIRQRLILSGLTSDSELIEAFDRALDTNSLLKINECPVLDNDGNPLIKNKIYQYRELIIKVRDWEFGSGNLINRYYRVFYTDTELNDSFLVVDAIYPDGVFGGAKYQSTLEITG